MARKDANPGAKEDSARRRNKVLELRMKGLTIRQIAEEAEVKVSPAQVHRDLERSMSELRKLELQEADELRTIELLRLEALQKALWDTAMGGDVGAVDRLIRLSERRSKLLGLDAPTKVAPTSPDGETEYQGMSDEQRTEAIARLLNAARARRDGQVDSSDGGATESGD